MEWTKVQRRRGRSRWDTANINKNNGRMDGKLRHITTFFFIEIPKDYGAKQLYMMFSDYVELMKLLSHLRRMLEERDMVLFAFSMSLNRNFLKLSWTTFSLVDRSSMSTYQNTLEAPHQKQLPNKTLLMKRTSKCCNRRKGFLGTNR